MNTCNSPFGLRRMKRRTHPSPSFWHWCRKESGSSDPENSAPPSSWWSISEWHSKSRVYWRIVGSRGKSETAAAAAGEPTVWRQVHRGRTRQPWLPLIWCTTFRDGRRKWSCPRPACFHCASLFSYTPNRWGPRLSFPPHSCAKLTCARRGSLLSRRQLDFHKHSGAPRSGPTSQVNIQHKHVQGRLSFNNNPFIKSQEGHQGDRKFDATSKLTI